MVVVVVVPTVVGTVLLKGTVYTAFATMEIINSEGHYNGITTVL